jgi:hypothetical protein
MLFASSALAQNVLRVPEDYATIQEAVNAASPGDTVRVGPGNWCGAAITKRLTILGEGRPTIIACTPSFNPDTGKSTGFLLNGLAAGSDPSGTTIQHFNFSGVHSGVWAILTHGVSVEHNTMQLAGTSTFGIRSRFGGSSWTVSHNTITIESPNYGLGIANLAGNDWTVTHNTVTGTGARGGIYFNRPLAFLPRERSMNNYAAFNHIEGAADWFGIGLTGQEGAVVSNNEIFLPTSPEFIGTLCGAWGIEVSDSGIYGTDKVLTSINSVIVNNDTRGTSVGVIVLLDSLEGTGNSVGNVLRGNFGTLAINQPYLPCGVGEITGVVKSRAISTLITCNDQGICTDAP